jgi:hypothetical protein
MIPSVGRIVHLKLSDSCADNINKRRNDAKVSKIASTNSGAMVHVGNDVRGGDIFPMIITRIWSENPDLNTAVNGQVFLDGNDLYWTTSVKQGTELGQWQDPRGE